MNDWGYLGIGLTAASAVLIAIIDCYKNAQSLQELFAGIRKFLLKLVNIGKTHRRRKLNKVLSSEEYVKWQRDVLLKLYGNAIDTYNINNGEGSCCVANAFGYQYEAVYFPTKTIKYPFKDLKKRSELGDFNLCIVNKNGKKKIKYAKQNKLAKKYYKLLKPTISFPNNVGYMLDSVDIAANSFKLKAYPSTYYMNVCQSNVLEYELYKKFKSKSKNNLNIKLSDLPLRKEIHKAVGNEDKILTSGEGRAALLGVQAMVFCSNRLGGYDVLRIKRSEHVDAKVGFYQFIPSGGFSALEDCFDHESISSNFSFSKAILREFLEECFGEEDFSGRKNISPESIYADPILKALNFLDNKKNTCQFIGTTMSLVGLRHELCFLIVIRDFDIIDKIRSNEECSNVIQFVSAKKLSAKSFWEYDYSKVNSNDDKLKHVVDYEYLNPTSAGLWNLVRQTEFYKGLGIKGEEVDSLSKIKLQQDEKA